MDGAGILVNNILRAMKINPEDMKKKFDEFLGFTRGLFDTQRAIAADLTITNARLTAIEAELKVVRTFIAGIASIKNMSEIAELGTAPAPINGALIAAPNTTQSSISEDDNDALGPRLL